MIVVVALDNANGMAFNHRRQSQDSVMVAKLMDMVEKNHAQFWMSLYSKPLFEGMSEEICAEKEYLANAFDGDYCFVELDDVGNYESKIEKIIVFRWNRDYPSDKKFDIDLSLWKMNVIDEFEGSSHPKITVEVYDK